MKRKIAVFLATAALLIFIGTAYALDTWDHTLQWNKTASATFNVFSDAAMNTPWSPGGTENITDPNLPFTETYYIANTGNVPITVTASLTFNGASHADVLWAPGNQVNITVGSNANMTLTLANFTVGSGSCHLSLSVSQEAS